MASLPSEWEKQFVLALDGGGVRGYSILLILQALMAKIEEIEVEQAGSPGDVDKSLMKPCYYFDWISGTGTGGLIAIFLARLRMSVDEAIEAYCRLDDAFGAPRTLAKVGMITKYDSARLETCLEKIVDGNIRDGERTLFATEDKFGCKAIVCAAHKEKLGTRAHLFRSFHSRDCLPLDGTRHGDDNDSDPLPPSANDTATIIQAARVTLAVPLYFDPVVLNKERYIEGGVGGQNPTLVTMQEIEEEHRSPSHIGATQYGTIINIGAGSRAAADGSLFPGKSPTQRSLGSKTLRSIFKSGSFGFPVELQIDKENVKTLQRVRRKVGLPYQRFDAGDTFSKATLDTSRPFSKKNFAALRDWTNNYLSDNKVEAELRNCARELVEIRRKRVQNPSLWKKYQNGPSGDSQSGKNRPDDYTQPSRTQPPSGPQRSNQEARGPIKGLNINSVLAGYNLNSRLENGCNSEHFKISSKLSDIPLIDVNATSLLDHYWKTAQFGHEVEIVVMMATTTTADRPPPEQPKSSYYSTNSTAFGETPGTTSSQFTSSRGSSTPQDCHLHMKDWAIVYTVRRHCSYNRMNHPLVIIQNWIGQAPKKGEWAIYLKVENSEWGEYTLQRVYSPNLSKAPIRARLQHRFIRPMQVFCRAQKSLALLPNPGVSYCVLEDKEAMRERASIRSRSNYHSVMS